MRTPAYRRRRQLARQRRKAAEVESWRRWKEQGGIMGYLRIRYADPLPGMGRREGMSSAAWRIA